MASGDVPGRGGADGTRSEVSGRASDVVQARDISGGIHFHGQTVRSHPIPRQLPGDVHGFANRISDIERLDTLLGGRSAPGAAPCVCVIAGTAGVGKTSLAVHWAHQARTRFRDGQLYVNLRGYDPGEPVDALLALERFLLALEVPAGAIPRDLESRASLFRTLVADRRMLIVLDNAATVGQVRPLLPGTNDCLVLVTSRSRLSGLSARDGAVRVTLEVFPEGEAVRLLRMTTSDYRAGDGEDEFVELARLCARLPLALRIAAERAAARPMMPLAELIQDLRGESSLWDALSAEDGEEADAVRTVFAWSYRALVPEAARVFRLMGLHPGPVFSAAAVCALAAVTRPQARHLLDTLVGCHMMEQTGPERYQFHDLLRAYALDQVAEHENDQERREALRRACLWYLYSLKAVRIALDEDNPNDVLLASDEVEALVFADQAAALEWFEGEVDNLTTAVRAAADNGLDEIAWQLAAQLVEPFIFRHPFADWLPLGLIGLESARRVGDRAGQLSLLYKISLIHRLNHHMPQAIEANLAALEIARQLGDRAQEVRCLGGMGLAYLRDRHFDQAGDYFEQALAVAQDAGDTFWTVTSRGNLAETLFKNGQVTEAERLLRETLDQVPANYSGYLKGHVIRILALVESAQRRHDDALATAQEALATIRSSGNANYEAGAELTLGVVLTAMGRAQEALEPLQHSASLQRRRGDRAFEAEALDATGEAYLALERPEEAADFHRRAAALYRGLADDWNTAVALAHLGDAIEAAGLPDAASARREALDLLAAFSDSQARALSDGLTVRLAE